MLQYKPIIWTPDMDAELTGLRRGNSILAISGWMQLSFGSVQRRCRKLKLPHENIDRRKRGEPTRQEWEAIATECAKAAGVCPFKVMAGCVANGAARARGVAWKTALDRCPRWSIAGVARVSGFHHTAIMAALKRIQRQAPMSPIKEIYYRPERRKTPLYDARIFVPAESVPAAIRARPRAMEG